PSDGYLLLEPPVAAQLRAAPRSTVVPSGQEPSAVRRGPIHAAVGALNDLGLSCARAVAVLPGLIEAGRTVGVRYGHAHDLAHTAGSTVGVGGGEHVGSLRFLTVTQALVLGISRATLILRAAFHLRRHGPLLLHLPEVEGRGR